MILYLTINCFSNTLNRIHISLMYLSITKGFLYYPHITILIVYSFMYIAKYPEVSFALQHSTFPHSKTKRISKKQGKRPNKIFEFLLACLQFCILLHTKERDVRCIQKRSNQKRSWQLIIVIMNYLMEQLQSVVLV